MDLDKTIEELEAELQESTQGDQKADTVVKNKEDGEEEYVGGPTPEKDENMVAEPKPAKKVKKDTSEPTKDETEDEKMDSVTPVKEASEPKTRLDYVKLFSDMTKTEMKTMYSSYQSSLNEEDEEEEEVSEEINVKEDVEALVKGEKLTEKFKKKAETIFESAVQSKLKKEIQRIQEEKDIQLQEEVATYKEELAEKIDSYLTYVVKEWMEENKLAVERGIKTEIAEEFISGMKTLFEEHYIDIPDEKYNVVEEQSEKIDELETRLNETVNDNIKLSNKIGDLVRESLIYESCEGLTYTEADKFKSLCEDIEYVDNESFVEKLNTIKESYFGNKVTAVESTSVDTVDETKKDNQFMTESVSKYVNAISSSRKFYKK